MLSKSSGRPGTTIAGGFMEIGGLEGDRRTFCILPKRAEWQSSFEPTVNEKASDEVIAHMSMFFPKDNPGYYAMSERAKEFIVSWVDKSWYGSSEGNGTEGKDYGEGESLGGKIL
jgi:hypothetical protein